uniref:hypothetical protein n=1 Tax=Actinoplanes sp. CA-151224 TaxID=3239904 RepID=UPI003F4956AE
MVRKKNAGKRGGARGRGRAADHEPDPTGRAEVRNKEKDDSYLNDEDVRDPEGLLQGVDEEKPTRKSLTDLGARLAASIGVHYDFESKSLHVGVRDPGASTPFVVFFTGAFVAAGLAGFSEYTAAHTHDVAVQHLAEGGMGIAGFAIVAGTLVAYAILRRTNQHRQQNAE